MKELKKQIESILNQTYKNIEIIICDDGSTDDTINILNEFVNKYSFIHLYINEQKLGFVKNFEKAISLCNGDYIALSDQDDIWFTNKLEVCMNNIKDKDVICSSKTTIDENDNILESISSCSINAIKKIKNTNNDYTKILLFCNFVTGCTILMKKTFISKILPFPDDLRFHDHWIAIVAACNDNLIYLFEPLMYYRIHNSNVTSATRIKDKNHKELSDVKKLTKLINFSQLDILKKTFNGQAETINLMLKFLNFSKSEYEYAEQMQKLIKSIIDFKFSFSDIKLIFFQLKNSKYISHKWYYFGYLILLRLMFFIQKQYKKV